MGSKQPNPETSLQYITFLDLLSSLHLDDPYAHNSIITACIPIIFWVKTLNPKHYGFGSSRQDLVVEVLGLLGLVQGTLGESLLCEMGRMSSGFVLGLGRLRVLKYI